MKKVREYVDKLLSEEHSEDDIKEYALKLGSLWGFMVEKEYGWKWKNVDFGDNDSNIYLVSENNTKKQKNTTIAI